MSGQVASAVVLESRLTQALNEANEARINLARTIGVATDTPMVDLIDGPVRDLVREVARLRRVVVEGVMLTSDKLDAANGRAIMAEHRTQQARNALRAREGDCRAGVCRWREELL